MDLDGGEAGWPGDGSGYLREPLLYCHHIFVHGFNAQVLFTALLPSLTYQS